MRAALRRAFDAAMGWVPPVLVTGLLKAFANRPELGLRAGFRVYPQMYYSPLVNPAEIDRQRLRAKRHLPGIAIDWQAIERWIEVLEPYAPELEQIPRVPGGREVVWWETYPSIDTAFLYCLVRHLKPRRYIEVGCGYSSRVSSMALRRNAVEGHYCDTTYIEPFPGPRLDGFDLFGELLVKKIEEVPLDYFRSLAAGDVLFIDTSHVIKCQNDVEYELLHVLPSLAKGVHIHVHDVFTPYDVAEQFVLGPRAYWGAFNEQYAVECLLSGGGGYAVTLPLHLLGRERADLAGRLMPGVKDPAHAIWMRKEMEPGV